MKKKKSSVFAPYLKADEEIIWHGRAIKRQDLKRKKGSYGLYMGLLNYFSRQGRIIMQDRLKVLVLLGSILILFGFPILFVLYVDSLDHNISLIFCGMTLWVCLPLAGIGYLENSSRKQFEDVSDNMYKPWVTYRYAISNQRILILENQQFSDLSLLLTGDIEVRRPVQGLCNIRIYDITTGSNNPEPAITLYSLSEEDARIAEDLLLHAQDEAYEERSEEDTRIVEEMLRPSGKNLDMNSEK